MNKDDKKIQDNPFLNYKVEERPIAIEAVYNLEKIYDYQDYRQYSKEVYDLLNPILTEEQRQAFIDLTAKCELVVAVETIRLYRAKE